MKTGAPPLPGAGGALSLAHGGPAVREAHPGRAPDLPCVREGTELDVCEEGFC